MIRHSFNWLLDWFLPRYCLGCRAEGFFVCRKCYQSKIVSLIVQVCPQCGSYSNLGIVCDKCKKNFYLDGLLVCLSHGELISRILYEYKYNDMYMLDSVLAGILRESFTKSRLDVDMITSVPLNNSRYCWRGYNQSARMSMILAKMLGKKYRNILVRQKFLTSQVGLTGSQRWKNVKNNFIYSGKYAVEKVLLVDDVSTTGATLNECAKVLKKGGVKKVIGLVLLRGV